MSPEAPSAALRKGPLWYAVLDIRIHHCQKASHLHCLALCYGSENPLYGPLYGAKWGIRDSRTGGGGGLPLQGDGSWKGHPVARTAVITSSHRQFGPPTVTAATGNEGNTSTRRKQVATPFHSDGAVPLAGAGARSGRGPPTGHGGPCTAFRSLTASHQRYGLVAPPLRVRWDGPRTRCPEKHLRHTRRPAGDVRPTQQIIER